MSSNNNHRNIYICQRHLPALLLIWWELKWFALNTLHPSIFIAKRRQMFLSLCVGYLFENLLLYKLLDTFSLLTLNSLSVCLDRKQIGQGTEEMRYTPRHVMYAMKIKRHNIIYFHSNIFFLYKHFQPGCKRMSEEAWEKTTLWETYKLYVVVVVGVSLEKLIKIYCHFIRLEFIIDLDLLASLQD